MKKKLKPIERKHVYDVLKIFFYYNIVLGDSVESLVSVDEHLTVPEIRKKYFGQRYTMDYRGPRTIDTISMAKIVESYNEIPNKGEYLDIFLSYGNDGYGYKSEPMLVGKRLEADDEYNTRCEEIRRQEAEYEELKKKRKQQSLETKKIKLEKQLAKLNKQIK